MTKDLKVTFTCPEISGEQTEKIMLEIFDLLFEQIPYTPGITQNNKNVKNKNILAEQGGRIQQPPAGCH